MGLHFTTFGEIDPFNQKEAPAKASDDDKRGPDGAL